MEDPWRERPQPWRADPKPWWQMPDFRGQIRRSSIQQRLKSGLNLDTEPAMGFTPWMSINYPGELLLEDPLRVYAQEIVAAAEAGTNKTFSYLTVPANELWEIQSIVIQRTTGTTVTFDVWGVVRGGTRYLVDFLGTVSTYEERLNNFKLFPGEAIYTHLVASADADALTLTLLGARYPYKE